MKCKQTREVIDTASRNTLYSDSVTTHLSGCPDCRRHADGTASLLTLLNAQLRVEAPADFDFRLSAGIARAQPERLNDKTASLLALLKAQPRVEAPADFDFRLSAGIARAQAERLSTAGVIEKAWERFARTFSLGHAATAMAAALLVATVSTIYINNNNSAPESTKNVAITRPADLMLSKQESAKVITAPVVDTVRTISAKSTGRGMKARPTMISYDFQEKRNVSNDTPSLEKFYSPKTQQVVSSGVSYGADAVSITLAKSAPITPSL